MVENDKDLLDEKDIENIKSKESWQLYLTRIQELTSKEKLTLKEQQELKFYKEYLLSSEEEDIEILKSNNLEKNYDAINFQSQFGEPFDSHSIDTELFNENE